VKLGTLIAVVAFSGAFFGVPCQGWPGHHPSKPTGNSPPLAFFGATPQRDTPLAEFVTGTFPTSLITTSWDAGRRAAGRRCFPKFCDPPRSPPPPPEACLGAAPRTCSSQELGHKPQPWGAKICSSNRQNLRGSGV